MSCPGVQHFFFFLSLWWKPCAACPPAYCINRYAACNLDERPDVIIHFGMGEPCASLKGSIGRLFDTRSTGPRLTGCLAGYRGRTVPFSLSLSPESNQARCTLRIYYSLVGCAYKLQKAGRKKAREAGRRAKKKTGGGGGKLFHAEDELPIHHDGQGEWRGVLYQISPTRACRLLRLLSASFILFLF